MSKIILSITFASVVIGALVVTKTLAAINKNIAVSLEAARSANIKIIKITTPDCTDCFNIEEAVNNFKKLNVKVEEEKTYTFDSPEASALIKKLSVKKVPTYLATGEITKNNLGDFVKSNGEINSDTFVFTKLLPTFIDTKTLKEMGKVTVTLITDSFCSECLDPKTIVESFKKAGVKVSQTKEFVWSSFEGQQIINQYKITKVPTFIFSSEFGLYDNVKSAWQNFGTVENDKVYVARNLSLPYRDLATGEVAGLVDLIYLTDSTCTDCYSAENIQKPVLTKGYRMALRSERFVDVASEEGQGLINQYKITKVPTILLSPVADQYTNLKNIWSNVGTVEENGWYVFREMQQLRNAIYKDLETNQIMNKTKS